MGWPSTLSYAEIVATGILRSLRVLAAYNDLDAAKTLLASNPSPGEEPEALAVAAANGYEDMVRLLLQHHPRLAERIAVVARTRQLTAFLFENGMNPNLKWFQGVTPLHRFARQGDVERAAIFLNHGADLHARDEELCTTPLGYAAHSGQLRMVQFLLRRGARLGLADDRAWSTPIVLATYKGHEAIVHLLRAFETDASVAALSVPSLDSIVEDLIEVCRSGESQAFLRVLDHFGLRRPMGTKPPAPAVIAARARSFVQMRLGLPNTHNDAQPFNRESARLLVARSCGVESWQELMDLAR